MAPEVTAIVSGLADPLDRRKREGGGIFYKEWRF